MNGFTNSHKRHDIVFKVSLGEWGGLRDGVFYLIASFIHGFVHGVWNATWL